MINRLIDTPYLSSEFILEMEDNSFSQFNYLIKELNCDPMNFLESLIIDPEGIHYEGIYLMMDYGLFLTEDDYFELDYEPVAKLTKMKRYKHLRDYLDKLDFHKVEYIMFSYFTKKHDYSQNEIHQKNTVLKGADAWARSYPEDKEMIQEYFETKCLDKIFNRMIEIKRKYVHA